VPSSLSAESGPLDRRDFEFGPSWLIYPLVVHGKPFNWATVPAFFPIMFELGSFLRLSHFCGADHERTAALVSSDF
jgi:hypothetical protein